MSIKILGEVKVPKNGYRELHLYADGRVRWLLNEGALMEGSWINDLVGEWKIKPTFTMPKSGAWRCNCSVCDHTITINDCYVGNLQYCPWCGARMESPNDCSECPLEWCKMRGGDEGKRPADCPVYGDPDDE